MPEQNLFLSISNPLMKWLLRSPLHGLASQSTLLVTVIGAKTGKLITTPVNYLRDGDSILVISARTRTWWRNLRGGREGVLRLRGADVRCKAEVYETDDAVAEHLVRILDLNPAFAKYLGLIRTPDCELDPIRLQKVAAERVIMRFHPL